jgi:hypothetical protein
LSSFSARLAILTGKPSGFELTAWFTLRAASDGIHPLTEAVTLQIANYTVTIPAGSFHQLWKARKRLTLITARICCWSFSP